MEVENQFAKKMFTSTFKVQVDPLIWIIKVFWINSKRLV